MTGRTARRRVLRVQAGDGAVAGPGTDLRADLLAVEEPLEIRLNGAPLTVTMRTPGDDIDLAAGFLAAEGVVAAPGDIAGIRMCHENAADVTLAGPAPAAAEGLRRNFLTTSACGVCGKDSIDAIRVRARYDVSADPVQVSPAVLASLPVRLREAQRQAQRRGQADRQGAAGRAPAARWPSAAGQRAHLIRTGPEGAGGRRPGARRGLRAVLAGRGACRGVRHDPGRVPAVYISLSDTCAAALSPWRLSCPCHYWAPP